MKKINVRQFLRRSWKLLVAMLILTGLVTFMMVYKLGTLTGGVSLQEFQTSQALLGWQGIFHNPFYWPLSFVRSVCNVLFEPSQTITRLPNVLIGLLSIGVFTALLRKWHGTRIALLGGVLFATTSWVLHVSRLASFDVIYLGALPLLLLAQALLYKTTRPTMAIVFAIIAWGTLLYIPGMIWFVLMAIFWERRDLRIVWLAQKTWPRKLVLSLFSLWWLLLLTHLLRSPDEVKTWLGLPTAFAGTETLRNIIAVPYQLLIQGPEDATLWLARLPLLDLGAMALLVIGLYFYARHWRSTRTRMLLGYGIVGVILIGLSGPVRLSLLVPLLFIPIAAGLAVLLRDWLRTFPVNPIARRFGIILVGLLVLSSAYYNLDRYFIAWPNNAQTQAAFRLKL